MSAPVEGEYIKELESRRNLYDAIRQISVACIDFFFSLSSLKFQQSQL
jgi:hypothetical protein